VSVFNRFLSDQLPPKALVIFLDGEKLLIHMAAEGPMVVACTGSLMAACLSHSFGIRLLPLPLPLVQVCEGSMSLPGCRVLTSPLTGHLARVGPLVLMCASASGWQTR
jgi:hypothetical protein